MIKTPQEGSAAYKCFNCVKKNFKNTSHRADDPRCPSRRDYLTIRQNMHNKSRSFPSRNIQNYFEGTPSDFPQIIRSANDNNNSLPKSSYAEVLKTSSRQRNIGGDLYSIEELFNIFTEAISDLRKCTTKMEQFNVIMSMLKYAI